MTTVMVMIVAAEVGINRRPKQTEVSEAGLNAVATRLWQWSCDLPMFLLL